MNDLEHYCEYFYAFSNLPICIYQNKKYLTSYPPKEKFILPPNIYLTQLWNSDQQISYTLTNFKFYYGCIKIGEGNFSLIIGPVNPLPYSDLTLLNIKNEYSVSKNDLKKFFEFFNTLPRLDEYHFINTLNFINYTINGISTATDHISSNHSELKVTMEKPYSEINQNTNKDGLEYKYYALEKEWMHYIETGNIQCLKNFSHYRNIAIDKKGNNFVNQLKDQFVIAFTLASYSAIKGGLDPSIAYHLLDSYMHQVKTLYDTSAILALFDQAQYDFASHVAELAFPMPSDDKLYKAMNFIRTNTHRKISMTDIAAYVNYTPSYLSRKFKQHLGFNITDFILRTKLEEAKNLLAFSDISISDISNLLCFSSQSHFQRLFKDNFGITPQTYRKNTLAR